MTVVVKKKKRCSKAGGDLKFSVSTRRHKCAAPPQEIVNNLSYEWNLDFKDDGDIPISIERCRYNS